MAQFAALSLSPSFRKLHRVIQTTRSSVGGHHAAVFPLGDVQHGAPAPPWVGDLVVYEVATPSFTSPCGPGSGTFLSMIGRLDHVAELGANAIWLSGHNSADASHFYNVWTHYAVVRPDAIDPMLGSREEFKILVAEAHARSIRVFLDVISHGVMASSSLVTEHPDWFRPGTWRMVDYDWFGDHPDLDEWWVDTWTAYVTECGVDGYRLDVATLRPDLWATIRERCAQAGHPIAVFSEIGPSHNGVIDFVQWSSRLGPNDVARAGQYRGALNVANEIHGLVTRDTHCGYEVELSLTNGERLSTAAAADLRIAEVTVDAAPPSTQELGRPPVGSQWVAIELTGLDASADLAEVAVTTANPADASEPDLRWRSTNASLDFVAHVDRHQQSLAVRFAERCPPGAFLSRQLSCHDAGWEGFPAGASPFSVGGSGFRFGYGAALLPAIPVFMAGEEFDASFRPNPRLTPDLYGEGQPGTGTWLYGACLDWSELDDPRHRRVFADFCGLLALRHRLRSTIRAAQVDTGVADFFVVARHAPRSLPAPYGYRVPDGVILVAGNPYPRDQAVRLSVADLDFRTDLPVEVTCLWGGDDDCVVRDGDTIGVSVGGDGGPRGGVGVWHLRRPDASSRT